MLKQQTNYSIRAKDLKRLMRRVQILYKRPWLSIPELDMAITTCCSRLNEYYSLKVSDFMHEYGVIESKWQHAQRVNSDRNCLHAQIKEELKAFLPKLESLRKFVMSNSMHYTKSVKRCIQKVWLQRACMKGLMKQRFYLSRDLSNIWVNTQMLVTEAPVATDWNCPICLEIPKAPIVLSCAHWFCNDCLVRAGEHLNKCPVCRKIQKLDPSHPTVSPPYRPLTIFLHTHFQAPLPAPETSKQLPIALETPTQEPTIDGPRRRRRRKNKRAHRRSSRSEPSQRITSEIEVSPVTSTVPPAALTQVWSNVVSNSRIQEEKDGLPSSPKRARRSKSNAKPTESDPVRSKLVDAAIKSQSCEEHSSRSDIDSSATAPMDVSKPSPVPLKPTGSMVSPADAESAEQSDHSDDLSDSGIVKQAVVKIENEPVEVVNPHVSELGSATECEDEGFPHSSRVDSLSDRDVNFGVLEDIEVLLQHAQPGAFFALDIDDTLHISQHHPCMMLSHQGIRAYQYLIRKKESYHNRPRDELEERRIALQEALNSKRLVQPRTADVVKALQDKGCWVFGLTSRYAEMADRTIATLLSLGIDLSLRSPFPAGKALFDPRTEAVCKDGIIFTNATNKAVVLNRFLEKVVFRSYPKDSPVPVPEIVFVDDRMENVEHLMAGLHAAASRSIKLTCYHYVGAIAQAQGGLSFDSQIVLTQIDHFMQHLEILPDYIAHELGEYNRHVQMGGQEGQLEQLTTQERRVPTCTRRSRCSEREKVSGKTVETVAKV